MEIYYRDKCLFPIVLVLMLTKRQLTSIHEYFWETRMGIQKLTGIGTPLQECRRIALVVHFGVGSTPDSQQFMGIRGFSCVFPKFATWLQKVISIVIYKCSTWNVLREKRKTQVRYSPPTSVGVLFPTHYPPSIQLVGGFVFQWEIVVLCGN